MTSTPVDLLAPEVKVGGTPLAAKHLEALVSVRVELGLCVVGRTTLRFSDAGYALSAGATFSLGTDVSIDLPGKGTLMSGQVTGVSLDQSTGDHPELIVVVDDLGYRLARGLKPATYVNSSYADVVRKLAQAAGLQAEVPAGGGMGQVSEYLLQTGTALSYLERATQRTGTVWWVSGTKLVVKTADQSVGDASVVLGESLLDFSVRASGLRPTTVSVSGWDYGQQAKVVGQSSGPAGPTAAFVSRYVGSAPKGALREAAADTSDYAAITQGEATTLASAVYDEGESGAVIARGTCYVNSAIKPAVTVRVTEAGPASGAYHVSEVEHTYSRRGFFTRFVAGPRRPTGLVDTLARPLPDPGFAVDGLVIGVVTDNSDPKNHGRVKVRFPALNGEIESAWGRVVSLGAGAQRGAVFQPEVQDEVLVGFEYGDSRRPVIIGGLFSPKNALPEAGKVVANGQVKYRRITSRKNHIVEFADGEVPTEQHVLIKLGTAEHSLRVGADAVLLEVAAGKPITIKAGQAQFAITQAGDVTIQGKNVTIKADVSLQLEGQAGVSLKSNAQLSAEGSIVDIKAQATASVNGGGALGLKGGTVMIN